MNKQPYQDPISEEGDEFLLNICKKQSFRDYTPAKKCYDVETANSTPEKTEQQHLDIDDLENIMDQNVRRFMKNKQLALQMQRSTKSNQFLIPKSCDLLPTRIMENPIEPHLLPTISTQKVRKDRSALVGTKRTRKSMEQIKQLQNLYDETAGKPSKAQLKALSKRSGLKLQQVYKWYWDTEKKNDKLQKELKNHDVKSPQRVSRRILKNQYTDEFGGYSKTWFSDGLKKSRKQEEEEMQDIEMDGLAKMVGLDIEAIAIEVATRDSWEEEKPKLTINEFRGIGSLNSTPNESKKSEALPVFKQPSLSIALPQAQPSAQQKTTNEDIFSPDKINNAFANLFGGPNSNDKITETPSFFEKHQQKAKPKMGFLKGRNLSSVFSPVPCNPQSEASVFDKLTAQIVEISPISSKLPVQPQKSTNQRITPIHFLKQAEPALPSPKILKGICRLFGQLKQTPKQFKNYAGSNSNFGTQNTQGLNIFRTSSCSNFYDSNMKLENSQSSYSRIASPMVSKAFI